MATEPTFDRVPTVEGALRSMTECHTALMERTVAQERKRSASMAMRQAYEKLWIDVIPMATEKKKEYISSHIQNYIDENSFTLSEDETKDHWLIIEHNKITNVSHNKNSAFIGKNSLCDVILGNVDYLSRIHCFIVCLPNRTTSEHKKGIFIIVDIGGRNGVQMVRRSSALPLQHSMPNERDILICGMDEQVEISTLSGNVVIAMKSTEPKDCSICVSNIRNAVLSCGHHICTKCYESWALQQAGDVSCPYCRKPISRPPVPRFDRNETMIQQEDMF